MGEAYNWVVSICLKFCGRDRAGGQHHRDKDKNKQKHCEKKSKQKDN